MDLITPPDDCHVNYTLSFSMQVCRVEDILVNGGGGQRIQIHWSKIAVGEEYIPLASVDGTIDLSGGAGSGDGLRGEKGTITGKQCPPQWPVWYILYNMFFDLNIFSSRFCQLCEYCL